MLLNCYLKSEKTIETGREKDKTSITDCLDN